MTTWRKAVEARLGDRVDVGKDGLRRFWSDLPERDVMAALELVEIEVDVRPGLLRPDDRLHDLFEAPPTRNPFRWLEFQTHSSDGMLELSYQLNKRLRANGRLDEWGDNVYTVDEFVRAWCGSHRSIPAR